MARDALARMVVGDAGVRRHAAVEAAAGVTLQIGLKQQTGVRREVEHYLRRDGIALFARIVELGVGGTAQAGDAIGHLAVVVHGTGDVEAGALLALGAIGHLHRAVRIEQRALAGQLHQAAGGAAAKQHGRGPAKHVPESLSRFRPS
ncbi:hypothetical protein G6F65_020355 [Rhizopus arrhizus]|nr:hypothetical protein G6F65_020355 [Rhizopus arrhizus]